MYHSLNAGENWAEVADPALPERYDRVPVLSYADGLAWLMTNEGRVLRSDDADGPWSLACELPAAVRCAVGDGSPSSIMGWR